MKILYAGADGGENYRNLLLERGCTNKLESYWSLKTLKDLSYITKFDFYLADSGGFVARNKGTVISVEQYAKWLNKWNIPYAFNLDTMDVYETQDNQYYLQQHTNSYILPVYHLSDYLSGERELIQDFIDARYPYIALGGIAGVVPPPNFDIHEFFRYAFRHTLDKIRVHGLGITSKTWLETYPFYSVDSTSWLAPGRFGRMASIQDERVQRYYAKKVHYLESIGEDLTYWIELENYITRLWEKRGVTWTD